MSENQTEQFEDNDEQSFEIEAELDGDDVEIEVVDDTPPEDRGRKPLEKEPEVTDDELQQYSKGVQERIKELRHGYHDERRAKEAALREREEAARFAQQLLDENKRLKGNLKQGEAAYLEAAKQKAAIEYEVAKKKLLEAKANGDIEAEISAQEDFLSAQLTKQKINNYENNALQVENDEVNSSQEVSRPQQVDSKAEAWHRANPWFWKDKVMTGTALGLHEDLVASGYDPRSDDYYRELDSRLREIFPSRLKADTPTPEKTEKKRPSTVVASANRSNPSKKVTLSASEVALARRLNLPIEVYAKQKIELEKRNG